MHERDPHVHRLLISLHGLLPIRGAWYFRINELTCADFYICDFDRCDSLVLVLYVDMIIFVGCLEQLMMWCLLILTRDVDLRNVGVWQGGYDPRLCSFIFMGG
jgi:hypothetical protein